MKDTTGRELFVNRKKIFLLCLGLILILVLYSCDMSGNVSENLEKKIISDMINEFSDMVDSEDDKIIMQEALSVVENPKSTSDEISQAVNLVITLKDSILNKKINFIDGAVERKVRMLLKKVEQDYVSNSDMLSITELDCSYTEEDEKNGLNKISFADDFKNMPNLKKLNLSGNSITNFSGLAKLTGLIELDISKNAVFSLEEADEGLQRNAQYLTLDLSMFNLLTNLEYLNISDNNITGLSILSNFKSLEYLVLAYNPITDLTGISNCVNLKRLDLRGLEINDISPLSKLPLLEDLNLSEAIIHNENGFSDLSAIKILNLSRSKVFSFGFLNSMSNLTELNLSETGFSNLNLISNLNKLTSLNISKNNVSDISALSNLISLLYLDASENIIQTAVLKGCNQLLALNISKNKLTYFSIGESFPVLNKLVINDNSLTTLNLSMTPELTELNANNNQLTDTKFLQNVINLKKLYLDNNLFTVFEIKNAPKLIILSLENVPIITTFSMSELTPLTSLNLWGSEIAVVTGLQYLSALSSLKIKLSSVEDFSFLSGLVNIEDLEIYGMKDDNWNAFNGYKKLKSFILYNSSVKSISFGSMEQLVLIKAVNCSSLQDLSQLYNLPALTEIYIENASVFNPTISSFPSLKRISLIDAEVEKVKDITELPSLEYLDLSENKTFDELVFSSLPALKYLDLSSNKISDLKILDVVINMGSLDLSDNRIKKVTLIAEKFNSLIWLNLSENRISDFSPIYPLDIPTILTEDNYGDYEPPAVDEKAIAMAPPQD
ncbi:MAG: putative internalin-A [Clostridia bacterium]|nr:putative internalin-A [Clostridia bacterium]